MRQERSQSPDTSASAPRAQAVQPFEHMRSMGVVHVRPNIVQQLYPDYEGMSSDLFAGRLRHRDLPPR